MCQKVRKFCVVSKTQNVTMCCSLSQTNVPSTDASSAYNILPKAMWLTACSIPNDWQQQMTYYTEKYWSVALYS